MRHVTFIAFLLVFSVWLVSPVWAQDPIVYPAKGHVIPGPKTKPVSIP
jgi:hypothetical protein